MRLEGQNARVRKPSSRADGSLTHVRTDIEDGAQRGPAGMGKTLEVEPHVLTERLR